jgi:hypothetical protein
VKLVLVAGAFGIIGVALLVAGGRGARVAGLRTALMAAWRNVAPAKLAKRVEVS